MSPRIRGIVLAACALTASVVIASILWPRPAAPPASQPEPTPPAPTQPAAEAARSTPAIEARAPVAETALAAESAEPAAPTPVAQRADAPQGGRRLVLRGRPDAHPKEPEPFADGSGKEAVQRAMREITPAIADCYEQGLRIQPELAGRILLQFTIEAKDGIGRVLEAEIVEAESTLDAIFVQACILDALSGATFPQPRDHGAVVVRHPFDFRPK